MRIVQFTDTHLLSKVEEKLYEVDTYFSLKKAFEKAMSLSEKPSAIIVTGDIAEDGYVTTYRRFQEIFENTKQPVFALPGNHDDLTSMKSVFRANNIRYVDHAVLDNWICIFANSVVPDESYGFIQKGELIRIKELATIHQDKQVVLLLHHPPNSPCPASGCKLKNADELENVLKDLTNLKIVVSGHLHIENAETLNDVRYLSTPSTFAHATHPRVDQKVDFEDFWASHSLDRSKRGFRTLDLLPDGNFKTEVHWF